jgi:hypothetical protein
MSDMHIYPIHHILMVLAGGICGAAVMTAVGGFGSAHIGGLGVHPMSGVSTSQFP